MIDETFVPGDPRMLPLLLALSATPVDTCRFDLPGPIHRSPDNQIQAAPLYARGAVDSLGAYAGWLFLAPGAAVAEHQHDGDELVFAVCGSARMRIGGEETAVTQGASVRIPKGTPHAALVGAEGLVMVQVYRPGAPGLRYYDWPLLPAPPPRR